MTDPFSIAVVAAAGLVAVAIMAAAALVGWHGWLRLQHAALAPRRTTSDENVAPGYRIELADLRERVRKLEAIAAGVEL